MLGSLQVNLYTLQKGEQTALLLPSPTHPWYESQMDPHIDPKWVPIRSQIDQNPVPKRQMCGRRLRCYTPTSYFSPELSFFSELRGKSRKTLGEMLKIQEKLTNKLDEMLKIVHKLYFESQNSEIFASTAR